MKKSLLLFLSAGISLQISAQNVCDKPQSQIDLHANNISARILNGGYLFSGEGQFVLNPPAPGLPAPSTMIGSGFWLGGLDPAGNLKISAVTDFGSNPGGDFWQGPLSLQGTTSAFDCSNWDRHFRVTGAEIADFLTALPNLANDPDQALLDFKAIMGWPGIGNPYFANAWGFTLPNSNSLLAPFVDTDQDGIYNPLHGDYPAVVLHNKPPFVPAEIIWTVFNDQGAGAPHHETNGKAFQVEVQLTAWAFNCPDQPVLNNTVFTSHKIINRASDASDDVFIGYWVNFGIGCPDDDYVGCKSDLNCFFGYNKEAVDGSTSMICDDNQNFQTTPPVQSVTFLNKRLDRFIAYPKSVFPTTPGLTTGDAPAYYNMLRGLWSDGTPQSGSGNGYDPLTDTPTYYGFDGDPSDPFAWTMCSANLPNANNYRAVASHNLGQLLPGQVEELSLAWTAHPDPDLPCSLGTTFDDVASIHNLFDNNFTGVCAPVLTASERNPGTIDLFPNPATDAFTLRSENLPVRDIRIYAADGRWIKTISDLPKGATTVEVKDLPAGMYEVQMRTDAGNLSRKLCIVK